MKNNPTHCGFVALVGRPNVGKSTLLNALLAQKISIISHKPQTTRDQILGIKTTDSLQVIYVDTPGIHMGEDKALNLYMNKLANTSMSDVDVIIFMVDATRFNAEDAQVLNLLAREKKPVILAINKIDMLADTNLVLPLIQKLSLKRDFVDIVPISAKKIDNIAALEEVIAAHMPAGPFLYPKDQTTDKSEKFQISELIREKVIFQTEQEIPYSTYVEIEEIKTSEKLVEINTIIWVERDGQKSILIGKNGERVKKIGTQARLEIEKLLGRKVFLRLWVKVKDNWTDNEKAFKG